MIRRSSWKIRTLLDLLKCGFVKVKCEPSSLFVFYSNSWRRRPQSPMSRSDPSHRRPARPSTAAWCRSSMMKTGSVEYKHSRRSVCGPPPPRLPRILIWFHLITCAVPPLPQAVAVKELGAFPCGSGLFHWADAR